MCINKEWLFPSCAKKAVEYQRVLAEKVVMKDELPPLRYIGGMDVSNNLYDPKKMIYASAIVLDFPKLQLHEEAVTAQRQDFPYIPGLLGFREAPALIEAYDKLKQKPDILLVDGHGISHPRGLGIASHIGVLLDIPTIGVAKSFLVGEPAHPLSEEVGSSAPLIWKGQTLGMVVRTKVRSHPLIISVGHKISLETAIDVVQKCLRGYRLPLPTKQAHVSANICRKDYLENRG